MCDEKCKNKIKPKYHQDVQDFLEGLLDELDALDIRLAGHKVALAGQRKAVEEFMEFIAKQKA